MAELQWVIEVRCVNVLLAQIKVGERGQHFIVEAPAGDFDPSEFGKLIEGVEEAKAIGENVAGTINSVYTNGNGHYTTINLKGDLNYTLMVNDVAINSSATVAVIYNNKITTSNLIPKSSDVNQVTMRPNETYKIYNDNGVIKFSKLS